ncbi:MAG: TIGR02186 family protein [Alphaproteobacteria bacterium]|nr:TIGR02186 family protein [Alphaproteobacteria bacterium]MCD8571306.1 TIGR02186 family protein [Alphaproteobacteria bacterium]
MPFVLFILSFMVFAVPNALAQGSGRDYGQSLAVDLASDHVDITTGFHGSRLVLFGVQKQPGTLAVVVKGPERTMLVRRKGQVLGAWINTRSVKFRRVPSYYDYAISGTGKNKLPTDLLREHGIGLDALYFDPDVSREDAAYIRDFQEALIRNKQAQGVYPVSAKPIKFISGDFFRAEFYMPPNLPSGRYEVHTYLIQDGDIIDDKITTLRVAQVGFNASVNRLASDHAFIYALLGLFIAVGAGWSINLLRR